MPPRCKVIDWIRSRGRTSSVAVSPLLAKAPRSVVADAVRASACNDPPGLSAMM